MNDEEYNEMDYDTWRMYVAKTGDLRFTCCCEHCNEILITPYAIMDIAWVCFECNPIL